MRRLIKFMAPYRAWALIAPALMALEVAMDLAQPRLLQTIVDVGIANQDGPLVLRTLAIMIGVALVGAVGGIGCTIYATRAAQASARTCARGSSGRCRSSHSATWRGWRPGAWSRG
jgi:ATP-binding cassette subfamily B multidrug efflux pump